MKRHFFLLLLASVLASDFKTQNNQADSAKKFLKRYYSANQKELDKNISGIGIEFSSVKYGDNYQPVNFEKVNIRAKRFEFIVGAGDCYYYSPETKITYNTQISNWSIGFNQPISVLGIGRANSTKGIRLLPFVAFDLGHSTFRSPATGEKPATAFHLGVSPGYRIKIPYFIIDLRLNTTCNLTTETKYHPESYASNGDPVIEHGFKRFNVTPSISIILDGLFSKFKPIDTQVSGNTVVYDNISKKEYYLYETQDPQTGKTRNEGLYKTETTYQYHTEAVALPVSNIGAFIGIGPRLLFRPVSKNSYRMPSVMGGFGVHGRLALLSMDLNVDKGSAGFLGQVNSERGIIKNDTSGKGAFNLTNLTANLGIDLGPVLLALLGTLTKRDGETPYFNISGGIVLGYSFLNNYNYNNHVVGDGRQAYFAANPDKSTIYNNPALNKSGRINGWYIGAEVGAVGFRYEYNRYNNAPLARCAYYAISYKFPLLKSKRKI